jgi:peptidyl-prolyl cis-trans isomerase SurA
VALQNFFLKNQLSYRWSTPRFNGALFECVDKKTGKKIKKILKKESQEDWAKLIEPFNKTTERIKLTQGIFKVGDNANVDALAFGGPRATATKLPYTFVLGKKQKSPNDYKEVREKVQDDYQKYMKQEWIDHLKTTTKVEISEEVLKTVNNH